MYILGAGQTLVNSKKKQKKKKNPTHISIIVWCVNATSWMDFHEIMYAAFLIGRCERSLRL